MVACFVLPQGSQNLFSCTVDVGDHVVESLGGCRQRYTVLVIEPVSSFFGLSHTLSAGSTNSFDV